LNLVATSYSSTTCLFVNSIKRESNVPTLYIKKRKIKLTLSTIVCALVLVGVHGTGSPGANVASGSGTNGGIGGASGTGGAAGAGGNGGNGGEGDHPNSIGGAGG
jgi:hypothetical protein